MSNCQEHYYVQRVMQIAQQHRCVLPSDLKRLFFVERDDSDPFDEKKVDQKHKISIGSQISPRP